MKRRTWMALVLALTLMLTLLAGCGFSSVANDEASTPQMTPDAEPALYASIDTEDGAEMGGGESDTAAPRAATKLIYQGSIEMETMEFDQAMEKLKALVEHCGGYVESSSLRNYDGSYRSADYTVRIPTDHYREFYNGAGELCHVLQKNENTENVTYAYYDTVGRLETQKIKLARLQELLKRAETMEDIITIESAISETEHQIEALSGEIRHYDDLVEYSTVNLNIREVDKLANTKEFTDSYGGRLGGAFVTGWKGFVDGVENITVFLAHYLMWIILLVLVVILVRKIREQRKRAEEKKPSRFHLGLNQKPQDPNEPKT